jgi:hypothetical protein
VTFNSLAIGIMSPVVSFRKAIRIVSPERCSSAFVAEAAPRTLGKFGARRA